MVVCLMQEFRMDQNFSIGVMLYKVFLSYITAWLYRVAQKNCDYCLIAQTLTYLHQFQLVKSWKITFYLIYLFIKFIFG